MKVSNTNSDHKYTRVLMVIVSANGKKKYWKTIFQHQETFLQNEKILLIKKSTYQIFTDEKNLKDTSQLIT